MIKQPCIITVEGTESKVTNARLVQCDNCQDIAGVFPLACNVEQALPTWEFRKHWTEEGCITYALCPTCVTRTLEEKFQSFLRKSPMKLYRYQTKGKPVTESGYWFDYGGIAKTDTPDYLPSMTFVPNWDKDYVCCCTSLQDLLTYFPWDIHSRLNGVYCIYEYDGKLVKRSDEIITYVTADAKKMQLLKELSYDEAMLKAMKECTV